MGSALPRPSTVRDHDRAAAAPRLRLTGGWLTCEVADSVEDLAPLREQWDRLVECTGGPIEMTYDWCRLWWEHYGAGRAARVFVFRHDRDIVGLIPVCVERLGRGPIGLRVARLMGSDSVPGLCDLPVLDPWAGEVIEDLLERLVGNDRCDAVVIGPLSEAHRRLDAVRGVAAARPDLVGMQRDRSVTTHTTIDVPQSLDEYLRSLSRNQRLSIRRESRRLDHEHDVRINCTSDPAASVRALEDFVRLHTSQWQARGRPGHFGDWPGARRFHLAMVAATDRARLLEVRAGGSRPIIAAQYAYLFGGTCHCRLAARSPEARWDRYAPGRFSLVKLIGHAIEHGARTIDTGTGGYDYKLRLGGRAHDVRSIVLAAARPAARRKVRLLAAAADALDHLYYKLWYCRVAPRLPVPTGRLWKAWIRSRW